MRVVGGRLRGRPITRPRPGETRTSLRPTSDRARESIFNLLVHGGYGSPPPPEGMRALDLFSGTGALGIEALSRGAAWCVFVETDPGARACIRRNLQTLNLNGSARVYRRDARALGASVGKPFDLVFLDPPYESGYAAAALDSAVDGGWLRNRALATVELPAEGDGFAPLGWLVRDERTYGRARIVILQRAD